jgi:aspartate aminotransferase
MALLNPGDEIIIPAPYWTSYPDMARLAEGTPIIVNTTEETYFKITASALEKAITKNTKLFLLNSPSNPTGQVYSHAELKALSEVLKKYPQIYIISDDIYESMYWGKEPFANIAMICPELKDRCLIINGVSKAYAMTGFRIGYTAGPKFIIDAMKKLQSQMTSNPNSLAQMATKTALESSQDAVKAMCAIFKTRYDFIFGAFSTLPFIRCLPSEGAFYLFFNVTDLAERLGLADDVAVANYFLDSLEIALVPGSAFGMPGYLRLSYASDESLLKAAALRMEKALKEL